LGGEYTAGTDEFNATDSIFASLVKEIGYRRSSVTALERAVEIITGTIADMTHEAPNDGAVYGRKNKAWIEITGGSGGTLGDAIEALKLYSGKTLTITNARIIDRRLNGRDLGLPYLNDTHEVYHFDTDFLNQTQQSNITLGYTGEQPVLVGKEDQGEGLFYNPAVKENAPFEMKGRSLLGRFSIFAQVSGEVCGAEFWARVFETENVTIFRFRSNTDEIVLRIGGSGPAYGVAEADGISYGAAEADGISYGVPETVGDTLDHNWQGGSESVSLEDEEIEILKHTWTHIAAVSTPDTISLFIGDKNIDFERHGHTVQTYDFEINEEEDQINIDELSLFSGTAPVFEDFAENSVARVPYAALDYRENWFVLEARDTGKVKTNLFETEAFKAAVRAVLAE
jgi:hypothetical protein